MREEQLIIGCDPGQYGAFYERGPLHLMSSTSMPVVTWRERGKSKKKGTKGPLRTRYHFSREGVIEYAFSWMYPGKMYLFLESFNSFTSNKATVGYQAYQGACIETAFRCSGFEVVKIKPKVWQQLIWEDEDLVIDKKASVGKKKPVLDTKATSYNAAVRLYPDQKDWIYTDDTPEGDKTGRKTKHHDGLVDAALVALAGDMIVRTGYVEQFQEWYDDERPWLTKPTTSAPVRKVVHEVKKEWKRLQEIS